MPKVGEVMAKDVVTVVPSAPITEVAQQMLTSGRTVVAVCDNGKFKGMISERDIVVSVVAPRRSPDDVTAASLVTNHQPTISATDDVWHAANLMVEGGTRVLPVVDRGKLVGFFSLDDLARESPGVAAIVFAKTVKLQASRAGQ